ncbi:MAG: FG-GAP-like repeat-containing protein [Planctomycetota bacterium]
MYRLSARIPRALLALLACLWTLSPALTTAESGPAGNEGLGGDIQIELTPFDDFNPPGTDHTLTAFVFQGDKSPDPVPGAPVLFEVILGPNEGDSGVDVTNEQGLATFTYTGDGGLGLDQIRASLIPEPSGIIQSNIALKFWDLDCNENGVPDACDIDCNAYEDDACFVFECGGSDDDNGDDIPDECGFDCNGNGIPDDQDIAEGDSTDFNENGVPDECEGNIGFEDPREFPAAGAPFIEALGDVDGNDTIDVVVAIPDSDPMSAGSVQVFRNLGTDESGDWLGLIANDPFPVGREPSSVALGLFNNDPHLDLAVTNAGENSVWVFFNEGTGEGTFVLSQVIGVGSRPSAVTAADFNRDTFVDLAVANEQDNDVTVLVNDGEGNFPTDGLTGGDLPTGGFGPLTLEPEDIDNDKDIDMAGINNQSQGVGAAGVPGSVFVLLNAGDGTFEPAITVDIGINPRDLSIGDLDRDDLADIVAVNADDATVSVLINEGAGAFAPPFELAVGMMPRSVDAENLDDDFDRDLAVVADDPLIGPAVQVLRNLIDGGQKLMFDEPRGFGVEADPNFVVTGDLNGDGVFDVVTVNTDDGPSGGSVTVLLSSPIPVGLTAPLDIKPGGCPNPLNRKSKGVLPVALVGTESFDVEEVDIASLRLSRADGVGGNAAPNEGPPGPHTVLDDVATPFAGELCDCHDLAGDGVLDLSMKFMTQIVVAALELNDLPAGATVELVLTGTRQDGTPFRASDCIGLVPPGDLDGNGLVDIRDLTALLAAWGPCAEDVCPADLDGDAEVGIADVIILLANWG